jgi:hypothetical protein
VSRKDYQLIAGVLATVQDPAERQRLALAFIRELHADNPRFNSSTFLTAVGGF